MTRGTSGLPWQDQPWGDLHQAWPLILEPVGLGEMTHPVFGGASRPTSTHRPPAGPVAVSERQAIALLRVPGEHPPTGRPARHLAWVHVRGAADRSAFSSQVTEWWPTVPGGEQRVCALSFDGGPVVEVVVHGDGRRWVSAPVRVPAGLLPGEPASLVLSGAQWPLPHELIVRPSADLDRYLSSLG